MLFHFYDFQCAIRRFNETALDALRREHNCLPE